MSGTEVEWATALLGALGVPVSEGALQALVAVAVEEGTRASDNPDDTTQPEPGATAYNTVGVRNYPSWAEGIAATAATLRNGDYPAILAALAAGDPAATVTAWAQSPWGTWSGDPAAARSTLAQVQANWGAYASRPVPGPGPTIPPPITQEDPMPQAVYDPATGRVIVVARSPQNHLLTFTPDPQDPSGWSVTDVTDALLNAYPNAGPYEVAS